MLCRGLCVNRFASAGIAMAKRIGQKQVTDIQGTDVAFVGGVAGTALRAIEGCPARGE